MGGAVEVAGMGTRAALLLGCGAELEREKDVRDDSQGVLVSGRKDRVLPAETGNGLLRTRSRGGDGHARVDMHAEHLREVVCESECQERSLSWSSNSGDEPHVQRVLQGEA